MPNLNTYLPSGETAHGDSVAFVPLLDKVYNEEQSRAIGKAMSPNTITAILGPPGTGKTSVIAEIASQLASRGLRVLISSQSNLSVDNALERVLDSDQIFRIRVGRPESVKFNSELLKERASDRYRRMLLEKSTRAFRELDEGLKSPFIKSSEEVDLLCSRVRNFVEIRESHKRASARLAVACKMDDQCKPRLRSCKSALEQALINEGLTDADLPNFLDSISALKCLSINPIRVFERSDNISLAPNHRQELHVLQGLMSAEQACEHQVATVAGHISDLENRISSSEQKQIELDRQLSHNKRIEQKRLTAGFWRKLGSYLADEVYDLEPLRNELRRLYSSEARTLLPSAMNKKREADDTLMQARKAREEAGQFLAALFGECHELKDKIKQLESDLSIADILIGAGGLTYAKSMRSATNISQAWDKLQHAAEEDRNSIQRVSTAETSLDDIARTMVESLPCVKELGECCQLMGIPVPLSLRNASEDVLLRVAVELRIASDTQRARKKAWGQISSAVSAYHSRLSEETVDLSRAAIAEANVVGATCSGIAGNTDFADDFDWVIIDEAGRATPLDLLMPMVRGRSIVLVGDHKQLPPLLNQEVEKELANDPDGAGLNGDYRLTLFERMFSGMPEARKEALRKQYRMVDTICDVVREISYRDIAIETSGAALTRKHPFKNLAPIHWIQCQGSRNRAETVGYGIRNWAEVEAVQYFLASLVPIAESEEFARFLREFKQGNPYEIGIIAMYRQQALALESAVLREQFSKDRITIEVGTVDAFQGREKDAIIVSFVETNPNKLRFFYDRKRLNVALSRARELLVIVGGLDVLGRRATVLASGRPVPNPLSELRVLFEECAAANNATREIHNAS